MELGLVLLFRNFLPSELLPSSREFVMHNRLRVAFRCRTNVAQDLMLVLDSTFVPLRADEGASVL